MIFYMRDESKPYIVSLDVEHEGRQIIQVGAVMLQWIGESVYQICRSLNVYVKVDFTISAFVQRYTDITNDFIQQYGISLKEAIEQ